MHETLKTLWYEGLNPRERFINENSEYDELVKLKVKLLKDFLGSLSDEDRETYQKIGDLEGEMLLLSEEQTFITGFQLGARLMLDALCDYHGSFSK